MSSIAASDIVELFEKDVGARKRLAELLISEPDIRLAIINAELRDVATKSDMEKLRGEVKSDMEKLRGEFKSEIDKLREDLKSEIGRVEGRISRLEERVARLEERVERLEERVARLEERVARLESRVNIMMFMIAAFNIPILLAIIGILLRLAFTPGP